MLLYDVWKEYGGISFIKKIKEFFIKINIESRTKEVTKPRLFPFSYPFKNTVYI